MIKLYKLPYEPGAARSSMVSAASPGAEDLEAVLKNVQQKATYSYQKCTTYGQKNCQIVIFLEKKSLRSRIVGQK